MRYLALLFLALPCAVFGQNYLPEEAAELRKAQDEEAEIPRLVRTRIVNQFYMVDLRRQYNRVATEREAEKIRARFDSLDAATGMLEETIGQRWAAVFDSKTYLYNLLIERANHRELLNRFETDMAGLRERRAGFDEGASVLVEYALQKRMLVGFEIALAGEMGDGRMVDSLKKIALPNADSLARLEPIVLKKRLFLDYAEVKIGKTPYSSTKPIPELKTWPHGIIWRVQLGAFTQKQAISIFRNAHPLAVQRGADGRWKYYAGGFATEKEADAAVEKLKKAGFRAPVKAVWMDGIALDGAPGEKIYRVEIAGGTLPEEVRAMGVEIVRDGERYVATGLDAAATTKLRVALEKFSELEVRVFK